VTVIFAVLVMVGRDLLILLRGIYIKKAKGVILQSNQLGKWTIGILALTMLVAMLRVELFVVSLFLWLSVAMLAGSLSLYVARFMQIHRLRQENCA